MTIDAHGPIDKQWIASAAKRVNKAVRQTLAMQEMAQQAAERLHLPPDEIVKTR
jgi:hypothetical protein